MGETEGTGVGAGHANGKKMSITGAASGQQANGPWVLPSAIIFYGTDK